MMYIVLVSATAYIGSYDALELTPRRVVSRARNIQPVIHPFGVSGLWPRPRSI